MNSFTEDIILKVFEWKTENSVILSRKELPLSSINEMPDFLNLMKTERNISWE